MRKNFRLSQEQRSDAREAIRLLDGTQLKLVDCVKIALQIDKDSTGFKSIRTEKAIDHYLEDCRRRVKQGTLRARTVDFYTDHLEGFMQEFARKGVDELSKKILNLYFDKLPNSAGGVNVKFRAVRAFLNWCDKQDPRYFRTNPIKGVIVKPLVREKDIEFLSIEEVGMILEAPEPHKWAFVLQLFAGIRPEELASPEKPGLQWEHINRKEKIIRVPGDVAKGNAKQSMARVLDTLPDNIWSWLKDAPKTGPVFPFRYIEISRTAKRLSGYGGARKWPSDGLRHTFATYHVAAFQNPGHTALLMGHRGSTQMLYRNYRGLTTKAEGDRFFGLLPFYDKC